MKWLGVLLVGANQMVSAMEFCDSTLPTAQWCKNGTNFSTARLLLFYSNHVVGLILVRCR